MIGGFCEGQTSCLVHITDEVMGDDPCVNIYKYIEVFFSCEPYGPSFTTLLPIEPPIFNVPEGKRGEMMQKHVDRI